MMHYLRLSQAWQRQQQRPCLSCRRPRRHCCRRHWQPSPAQKQWIRLNWVKLGLSQGYSKVK